MTIPEVRVAAVRPSGKEQSTTHRPCGVRSARVGGAVPGADGGERPGDRGRVLPRAWGALGDRGTAAIPTVVLTMVSASSLP
jgi:hypothetical protein